MPSTKFAIAADSETEHSRAFAASSKGNTRRARRNCVPPAHSGLRQGKVADHQGINSRAEKTPHRVPRGDHQWLPEQVEGRVDQQGRRRPLAETLQQPPEQRIRPLLHDVQSHAITGQQEAFEQAAPGWPDPPYLLSSIAASMPFSPSSAAAGSWANPESPRICNPLTGGAIWIGEFRAECTRGEKKCPCAPRPWPPLQQQGAFKAGWLRQRFHRTRAASSRVYSLSDCRVEAFNRSSSRL